MTNGQNTRSRDQHPDDEQLYRFFRAELNARESVWINNHIRGCDACTETMGAFDDLAGEVVEQSERSRDGVQGPSRIEAPHRATATRRSAAFFGWHRRHPGVAAALWLVFGILAGGGAAATYHILRRPDVVAPDERSGYALATLERFARWRLEQADLPKGTRYREHVEFLRGDRQADAVLFELPGGHGFDLCAFADDGSLLWSLRRQWREWPRILGEPGLHFGALRSLVTRGGGVRETTVCLIVRRASESCVLFVDPLTGGPRGWHIYPGVVGLTSPQGDPVTVLHAEPDVTRCVALGGQSGKSEAAGPALVVFRPDGRLVQDLRFPTIERRDRVSVTHVEVHWDASPPLAVVHVSDNVHFEFEIRAGRLIAPVALETDSLEPEFDLRRGEEGAWDRRLEEEGGIDEFLRRHAEGVQEVESSSVRTAWGGP